MTPKASITPAATRGLAFIRPFSIWLIVTLATPIFFANSAWDRFYCVRSSLIVVCFTSLFHRLQEL